MTEEAVIGCPPTSLPMSLVIHYQIMTDGLLKSNLHLPNSRLLGAKQRMLIGQLRL